MEEFSIDQKKLPGVKEVCRDFAVLEDHCLAHNLQEQEIENHLASNVHKSRLVQQDLRVAKRLQEEEDLRAKAQIRRKHQDLERIDNEIAQEIQDQLVRQAEQLRQQEENDEVIARKLQEREMKEERKRQKQLEANFEEQYYEDRGAGRPPSDPRLQYPSSGSPVGSRERRRDLSQGRSPDHRSPKLEQKRRADRNADYYPVETGRSRAPEHYNPEGTRGRPRRPENSTSEVRTKYPEDFLTERNRPTETENADRRRGRKNQTLDLFDEPQYDQEPVVSTKERFHKDDPTDRDNAWDKEKDRERRRDRDRERERDGRRNRDRVQHRDPERGQEKMLNTETSRDQHWRLEPELDTEKNSYRDRNLDRDKDRRGAKERDREKHRSRDRSRGRDRDDPSMSSRSRAWSEESLEDADYGSRRRVNSGSNDVFEEPSSRGHSGDSRSPGYSSKERGRIVRGEYGVKEATQGLAQMDVRDQELKDMEVARRLQEEELKATKVDKRAAQVAQDEEIARRLMEEEKKEYKRAREKEKLAMERQQRDRRAEGDLKPMQEEVVRPRTREEYDYQRARNNPKPVRPPPPRTPHYENVDSSYMYSENYSPRPPSRPDAAYRGAYYRQ
ncbi:coiled-coil domain-containing protein 50 isoform X1 [Hoplias malabaricus]|uniref:coiled-coil domain-containing protein 50 isoform X1 n=1 Tax=Hoplias malabaricus TaxID=27720 RepID=UPI003461F426